MTGIESTQRLNGVAHDYPPAEPLTDDLENETMSTETSLKLPTWAVGALITLTLAFLGQFGTTLYTAGQWQSRQEVMNAEVKELKAALAEQRRELQELRILLATQAQAPRNR